MVVRTDLGAGHCILVGARRRLDAENRGTVTMEGVLGDRKGPSTAQRSCEAMRQASTDVCRRVQTVYESSKAYEGLRARICLELDGRGEVEMQCGDEWLPGRSAAVFTRREGLQLPNRQDLRLGSENTSVNPCGSLLCLYTSVITFWHR
jgi:hypothetical protein